MFLLEHCWLEPIRREGTEISFPAESRSLATDSDDGRKAVIAVEEWTPNSYMMALFDPDTDDDEYDLILKFENTIFYTIPLPEELDFSHMSL